MMKARTRRAAALAGFFVVAGAGHGQLGPEHVLVVYDSRVRDSLLVAEHYAGSEKVAGGLGGIAGARPGVHTFDLGAALGETALAPGDIEYEHFISRVRDPIRRALIERELVSKVRVLVLTKGLPHRVCDTNNLPVGDNPANQHREFLSGDCTNASVDSELTLLWQDLTAGEKGGRGDSRADGAILNPYWRASRRMTEFGNEHSRAPKVMSPLGGPGLFWEPSARAPAENRLGPGDVLLVCRLDGRDVEDVRGMIDRAVGLRVDVERARIVLDESGSNGIADEAPNHELDNQEPIFLWGGDDFEMSRDLLLADGRFRAENIVYDAAGDVRGFCVGPRIGFQGRARVVEGPVVLLASEGGNAGGAKPVALDGREAGAIYAESFEYAPGAIFLSIESYNGRDFGGVGGWPGQQQGAEFVRAGGTFAILTVWEPFAFSAPQSFRIVKNFLLGELTWAEAAYSAIPVLSWQHMVLGDPLARVVRSSEDLNGDGVVDEKDLEAFDALPRDVNRDGRVDETDRGLIEAAMRR